MPRKNTEDRNKPGVYHVYNRGHRKRPVFIDDEDRRVFISLVARFARQYEGLVAVEAYCPMTTHYHLIVRQIRHGQLARFMASLIAAYTKHFNNRHKNKAKLFAGPYRSRPLTTPKQYLWVVAYVNDNHPTGRDYAFSSHRAYLSSEHRPPWLDTDRPLGAFGGPAEYVRFMANRETRKQLQREFFDD